MARCVILSIWVVASLVFIPVLVVQHEESITLHGENAELVICKVCKQRWEEDWNKITYSIFLFVATYVLPVLLVITAYIRMGCKLCTPSILMNNHDGRKEIIYVRFYICYGFYNTYTVIYKYMGVAAAADFNRRRNNLKQGLTIAKLPPSGSSNAFNYRHRLCRLLDALQSDSALSRHFGEGTVEGNGQNCAPPVDGIRHRI